MGWCHRHRGEYGIALRYYEAAIDRGEQSIAVEFDYDLAHCTAAGGNMNPQASDVLDRYLATIQRSRKENVLCRIGLFRVALHDLREFLFVAPESPQCGTIGQLLCMELLEAVATVAPEYEEFSLHIYAFLETAVSAPLPISSAEQEALHLKIEAGRLLRKGRIHEAIGSLQEAARRYSDLNLRVWAAKTWRDIAFHFLRLKDANSWYHAACKSLETGLYREDLKSAWSLLGLITKHTVDRNDIADYRSLLYKVFSEVGPDVAYLSAPKISEDMSAGERKLFLSTVLDLFPFHYADRWIFIGQGKNRRQIPNNDRVLEPFRPYVRNKGFEDAKRAAMAVPD